MSERNPGFAQFDQETIAHQQQLATQQEQLATQQAAEAAHNSNERQAQIRGYDDAAELEIYGSRGRTYVDAQGNALPPQPGKVEQAKQDTADAQPRIDAILEEPDDVKNRPQPVRDQLARQRRTEANRLKKELKANETQAQTDVDEVLGLVNDEGLSLAQAKLVVDMRRADTQHRNNFVDSRIADLQSQGVSAAKARKQAAAEADTMYARKDSQRLAIIKKNRLYSEAEYVAFTSRGNRTPDHRAEVSDVWDEAHAENAIVTAERAELQTATDRYVELSAQMRSGHLGRVAGGRLSRLLKLMGQGVSGRRSDELDTQVADARNAYRNHFNRRQARQHRNMQTANGEISEAQRNAAMIDGRLNELINLENNILIAQQTRTEGQRLAGARNWVARRWAESGRFGKVVMVAVPAAAIGVTGGLAAGALGLGAIGSTIAGFGTAYAGRKAGHGIASVATTNRANTETGALALGDEGIVGVGHLAANPTYVDEHGQAQFTDHTAMLEETTTTIVAENQRRRGLAGAVGAVVAGGTFGLTRAAVGNFGSHGSAHNVAGDHNTGTHTGNGGHHTGGHHNGNHGGHHNGNHNGNNHGGHHNGNHNGHNAKPEYNTHQYPWTVAHQMNSGHEMSTIHHAMNVSNANNGTSYHLVRVGDTMQVYNQGHALNAAQEAAFNAMMEAL